MEIKGGKWVHLAGNDLGHRAQISTKQGKLQHYLTFSLIVFVNVYKGDTKKGKLLVLVCLQFFAFDT